MMLLVLSMISCKSGSSPISPILPGGDQKYHSDRSYTPGYTRTGYTRGSSVMMIFTGPREMLESDLNPPRIINTMPTFSVRVENHRTALSPDQFRATVGFDRVRVNVFGDEVSFTPSTNLTEGRHRAQLQYLNPDGAPITFRWDFIVLTRPPELSYVFQNEHGALIIFFDREVEPAYITDESRWTLNGHKNVIDTRHGIFNMSNTIVRFAFKDNVVDALRSAEYAELAFTDNVGTTLHDMDMAIYNGGERSGCDPCPHNACDSIDCAQTDFDFCDDPDETCLHEPLENEDYAIAWQRYPDGCKLKIVLTRWDAIHVKNADPLETPYNQLGDHETEGDEYAMIPPGPGNNHEWIILPGESTGTIVFPANWKHEIEYEIQCRFCYEDENDCEQWEWVTIKLGGFSLMSAFDTTNPSFPDLIDLGIATTDYPNPVVLYGYELADYLEEIYSVVPLRGDDDFCSPANLLGLRSYGKERWELEGTEPYFINGVLYELREQNPCDLYVFAAAEDKAPDPANHKAVFPILSLQVFGNKEPNADPEASWNYFAHPQHTLAGTHGWEMDLYPWGDPQLIEEQCGFDNHELKLWRDPNCIEPCTDSGALKQDYLKSELAIQWWNLSDVFFEYRNGEILDIRVYVEDEVEDPMNRGPDNRKLYNWARSENIMEQFEIRHAQVQREKGRMKFVANNPLDAGTGQGGDGWKIYEFSGDTTETETSFISRRDENGETFLHLLIRVEDNTKIYYPTGFNDQSKINKLFSETVQVKFESSEDLPAHMQSAGTVTGLAVRYDLCADDNSLPTSFTFDRMTKFFPDEECEQTHGIICFRTFYYLTLKVTDDEMSSDSSTMNQIPVLYVSSRDHLLGQENDPSFINRLDYALSISMHGSDISFPYYGRQRGIGRDDPDENEKIWYGYDEFIVSGGIEVVTAEFDTQNIVYDPEKNPAVPVQSEADVLLIDSHGSRLAGEVLRDWDKQGTPQILCPIAGDAMTQPLAGATWYPQPDFRPNYMDKIEICEWHANMESFMGIVLSGSLDLHIWDKNLHGNCPDPYKVCSDFGMPPGFNPPANCDNYSWGAFWQAKSYAQADKPGDTKWLVLISCANMSGLSNNHENNPDPLKEEKENFRPDKNWAKVVEDGHLRSVCGFENPINPLGELLTTVYSIYLQTLVADKNSYDFTEPCIAHDINRWDSNSYTTDPSIAAWMEAAWDVIYGRTNPSQFMKYTQIHSAAAVDGTHKWYLGGIRRPDDRTVCLKNMKIFKVQLD